MFDVWYCVLLRCVLMRVVFNMHFRWQEPSSPPDQLLGAARLQPAEGGVHQGDRQPHMFTSRPTCSFQRQETGVQVDECETIKGNRV